MRKKIFRIAFIFVLSILFLSKIEAKNYTYSCDYMGTDNQKYTFKFEVNGETLNILEGESNPIKEKGTDPKTGADIEKSFPVKLENIEWKNGKDCPAYITLTKRGHYYLGEIGQKETGTVLHHYWTWHCKYETNKEHGINSITIKYTNYSDDYLTVLENMVYECNPDSKPTINSATSKTDSIKKMGEYEDKCVPINYTLNNGVLEVTFTDSGTYNGTKKSISYNKEVLTTTASTCLDYKEKGACMTDEDVACIWEENENSPDGGFCNVDNLLYVGCGKASDIPIKVPQIISFAVNLLKIATPIILIFIGMISLFKAMAAGKEDEMKKAQSSLIKKIISAVLVFFVVAIVQFIISIVAEDDEYKGFENCLNCFLNNKCAVTTYYKTVIGGEDHCTGLYSKKTSKCEEYFNVSNSLHGL